MFKKLYGRAGEPAPPPPVEEEHDADELDAAAVPDDDEHDVDGSWRARAETVIPGGASTGSKRSAALFGDDGDGPTHFARAGGCRLTTPGGRTFIDCSMSLGAVALGYADEAVTRAVAAALVNGSVSGLSSTLEVEVAERLCDVIPCAEQVRFLKTGAEGVAAAVRIARTVTGRTHVVGSGYFGWLDWSSDAAGVPGSVRRDFTSVPFDDVNALERACSEAGSHLAALVIEPVVERLPSEEWIAAARRICDERGAVLVFDEMKTGFRLRPGGYQAYAEVAPDLAVFGKAMANGLPLAAVVGSAAVMEAATRTWISSTLAGEGSALAAAAAVLDWHERAEVCEYLWTAGEEMQGGVRRAAEAAGVQGVDVLGIAPMWLVRFEEPAVETRFLELARERGVLFKRGAYNYVSLAHTEDDIAEIEAAASEAFVQVVEERGE